MSFIVHPTYRKGIVRYNAPSFQVQDKSEVKTSALAKFPEWSFQIHQLKDDNRKTQRGGRFVDKTDANSKSQKGKKITGHSNSRPVRRAIKRLGSANGAKSNTSDRKPGAIKHW